MWRSRFTRTTLANDTGAAAVEFALVFPLLAMLLFGTIECGAMYNAQLQLTSGARDAARSMAIDHDASLARAAALAGAVGVPITGSEVALSSTTCTAGSTVTVTITHNQPLLTGMFGATVPLVGKATRRCNG